MEFELKTERIDLSMWEESDAAWYRQLVGERGVQRGVDMPQGRVKITLCSTSVTKSNHR